MKNSFSVFIVVLFCAVLCVGLGFLNRDSSDSLGWNPNELYSNSVLSGGSSAFTNASLSSGDVPVGSSVVSMRGGSVNNSPFRHSSSAIYPSAVSLYAPAGVAYGHSSMSNGVSPIAHITSSAEYRSFGGGGNGGALGSSSSRHYASASSSAALSITAPLSYNGSSVFDHSSKSYGTSDVSNIQSSVMDNPVVASSSIYGPSSSVTDYINTYGTASYGSTSRSNVRGRQNSVGLVIHGGIGWMSGLKRMVGLRRTEKVMALLHVILLTKRIFRMLGKILLKIIGTLVWVFLQHLMNGGIGILRPCMVVFMVSLEMEVITNMATICSHLSEMFCHLYCWL